MVEKTKPVTKRSCFAHNKLNVTAYVIVGWVPAALYTLTTDDNALRKWWHMPPKVAAECT
jgi:hypothetical protein